MNNEISYSMNNGIAYFIGLVLGMVMGVVCTVAFLVPSSISQKQITRIELTCLSGGGLDHISVIHQDIVCADGGRYDLNKTAKD